MQQIQLVQLSLEELDQRIEAAMLRVVGDGHSKSDTPRQVNTQEAMALAGYTDHPSFRRFLKENGIKVVATRAKRKYYLSADILSPTSPKGMKRS